MKISTLVAFLLLIITSSLRLTAQQQLQLDCSAKLDIFFLLDASDSLSEEDFEKEKTFVINLLQRLIDDSRDAKAGYLTFTESVNNIRTLLANLLIVQFELRNVIFDAEGTNLLVPLDYAYDNIFTSNSNLRPDSQRILFQITDGRDEVSSISQLRATSDLLSAANVTTVAIGVGDLIDTEQLTAIATEPHEENVIIFSDLNDAIANVSKIIDRTCTKPRVIAISAVVESSTSITVKWERYTFATVNSYKICADSQTERNCVQNINSSLTELLIGNLTSNTRYEISVFAFTNLGVTPMSNVLIATTTETPGTPLHLNATSFTSSSITLTWQAVTGSNITSYQMCVSLSSGGNCIFEATIDASIGSLVHTQGDLEPNTTYYFRIRAISLSEFGEYSNESSATTALLGVPELLSAVKSSFHIIVLTWSAYTEASLSSFEICVKLEGSTSCERTLTASGTATSYIVTLLEAYTVYEVSLVAIRGNVRSEESNSITIQTGEKRPGDPTNVSATVLSPVEIEINWSSPASDQLYGVIQEYYICVREESGEACLFEITHNASITPFSATLSGLNPETTYRVRARAINGAGAGSYSDDFVITTDSVSAVTVSTSTVNSDDITITWTGGNIPTSVITGAVVNVTTVSTGAVQTITLGQTDAINGSYLLEQLQPGTQYIITVVISTSAGDTPVSNEISVATQESEPTGVPTITSTESRTSTSITLTLDSIPMLQRNGVILYYIVYYRADGESSFSSVAVPVTDQDASVTYTLSGLNPNTAYTIQVSGNNSAGEGPRTQSVNLTTAVSGAVQNLTSNSTSRSITVSFSAYTEGGLIEYRACLSISSQGACNQTQNTTDLAFNFTNLEPGQTYYITIVAVTQFGDSEVSQELSVTTDEEEPGSPNNLDVSVLSAESILITWTEVSPDQQYGSIIEYVICIMEVSSSSCTFMLTVDATSQTFSFNQSGLMPNTSYIVTVQGRNTAGLGDAIETTIQTEPLQAVILSAQAVDANRIRLSWSEPNVPSSLVTGGILTSVGSPSDFDSSYIIDLPKALARDFIAEGFYPATTYYFTIIIQTTLGTTPASNEASTTTSEAEPDGVPTNLRVETISANSIRVVWGPVPSELTNGVITMYTICIDNGNGTCVEISVNASPPLEYTFTDLEPETEYFFRIRAHTAVGPGPYTNSSNQTTSQPGGILIQDITATTATTVNITWNQLNISISYYEICVLVNETESCNNPIQINDETQTSYSIANLLPYTMYYVTISATTPGGYVILSPMRSITTQQQAPSSSPTNVTVTAVSDTTITITWETVDEEDRNGEIIMYEICVQTVSGGPCISTVNVTAPQTQVNITDLTNNTNYIIAVRAYTSAGAGPYSPEAAVTTSHAPPGEPVIIITVQSGPIVIIDGSIPQTGGPITGVEVCVRLPSTTDCVNTTLLNITDTSFNITIEELDPNEMYEVIVTVIGPGGNTVTDPVTITTEPEPPSSSPTNVTVTAVSDTTITITWETVDEEDRNGEIIMYEICVQTVSGGPCISTVNVTAPQTQVNITDLTNNTNYIIAVRAYTSAGAGPSSPEAAVTTSHAPPGEPVIIITVQSGPIVIINGSIPQTGGPITGVEVCVRLPSTTDCVNTTLLNITDTSFNITIEELDPNEMYEVIVTVIGPGGNTVTDPVTITTEPELPSGTVQDIQTSSETTVLMVNWTQPVAINDDNITYSVTISVGGVIINTIQTSNESVVITGLDPNTEYEVVITPSNSVGSGDNATVSVRTQQEQPEPLQIVSVETNSVQVMLTPVATTSTSVQIDHYEICVQTTNDTCDHTMIIASNENFNFTIQNLTANTMYRVIVIAITTDDERGPPSDVVTFTTTPLVPIDGVTNLDAVVNNLHSLEVSWDFTATSSEYEPTHFSVCLALESGGECVITRNVTADIYSVVIPEVEGDTKYFITVYPWNVNGAGPTAEEIITVPKVGEPVVTITAIALSSYEIYSEWDTNVIFSNISSFTICLAVEGNSVCIQTLHGQTVYDGEVIFTGLTPNTSYTVHIVELASITIGAITEAMTPIDRISDSPLNVLVTTISSTILRVTWVPSSMTQSSNITSWEICYKAERFNETNGCTSSDKDQLYKSILNLEEHEYYSITVRAVYTDGNGTAFSVPVGGRTEQDVPSKPISGLVGVTEEGESKYIWLAPPTRDQNGIIVYYLVVFEYEDEGLMNISILEETMTREINIPSLVTVPFNISVTPFTIGAGPPYKIIGAVQEPISGESDCPDWRIAVTILCVLLSVLIIMAVVMCCIIVILIVKSSKSSSYSAV